MEIRDSDYYFNLICNGKREELEMKENREEIEMKENKEEFQYFKYNYNNIKEIWIEEIKDLQYPIEMFEVYGSEGYIGEEVSQLQHATQAALLAEEYYFYLPEKTRIELVIGAFLHDIGHLLIYDNPKLEKMGDAGVKNHEELGYKFLKKLNYPNLVCQLVKNHILTKRYLITTKDNYYNQLSEASKETFKYQGGKLSQEEINNFEQDIYFGYHLRMREFDDKAKSTDPTLLKKIELLNPIKYYKNLIERYVILYYI